jgi:two-component system sensor histidine kinase HydH
MRARRRFNPKYIFWISIILAFLMITTSFLVIKRIETSMLEILEKEGYALLESLITSSENSIRATDVAEELIEERLLDNAKSIDQIQQLNREKLVTIASETHLKRIDVFDSSGNLVMTSALYDPDTIAMPSPLRFIISGRSKIMSFQTDDGDIAVGVKRLKGTTVIVCYADAEYLQNLKQSLGIGRLIQKVSRESGIEYVLLQNEEGIVFATKNIERMKKISKDPFLKEALLGNAKASREFEFEGRKILEVVKPFFIDTTPYGIFRLGLSLEDYNLVLRDTMRHIIILSLFLFLIGIVIISFIVTNQSYQLLNESFKQMESFTKEVMDGITGAIISIDKDLIISYANKGVATLLSLRVDRILGKQYKTFFPSDELLLEKSLSLNRNIDEVEKTYTLPSGRELSLGITTSLLADARGTITGATALVRDLSLIKKLKQDAQEKERLKAIGDLASGVAHEIRNPLNALRLSLGKLKGMGEGEAKQLLEIIAQEIERIEKTVEDFLSFTKPFKLSLSDVNLNQIINDTVALLQEKALRESVVIRKELEVLPLIRGDEEALRKLFMNIIRNSIDASAEAGEIVITARSVHAGVQVDIRDTGVGIASEDLKRIFDPYFSKKMGGTGLGMSIAKRIIESHEGSISIMSEVGKGTTVRLLFPLQESARGGTGASGVKNG